MSASFKNNDLLNIYNKLDSLGNTKNEYISQVYDASLTSTFNIFSNKYTNLAGGRLLQIILLFEFTSVTPIPLFLVGIKSSRLGNQVFFHKFLFEIPIVTSAKIIVSLNSGNTNNYTNTARNEYYYSISDNNGFHFPDYDNNNDNVYFVITTDMDNFTPLDLSRQSPIFYSYAFENIPLL